MKGILGAALLSLILLSCNDTYCPSFPEILWVYLPYEQGDSISFTNLQDTVHFIIDEKNSSDSYSFPWNCKCECGADATIKTNLNEQIGFQLEFNINIINNQDRTTFSVSCSTNDYLFIQLEGVNPFNASIQNFEDTLILKNTNLQGRINDLKLVKNLGLAEFFDATRDCVWTMVR